MTTKLSVSLIDDYGRLTHRVYGMETQALLADYVTAVTAFQAALAAVTDLGVTKMVLQIPVASMAFAVTSGANKDTGATASGLIKDGDGKKASLKIPGIKPALVSTDGTVQITGAFATFLTEFEDTEDFNLSDGEQIDSWVKATLDG